MFSGSIAVSQPKIYINYVTHNEDTYSYLKNPDAYLKIRPKLQKFALECKKYNAKWSIGSDYVLLRAIMDNDTGIITKNTNNKNLLRWLSEDMDVECDPHSHESRYNIADIAYLHEQLGVKPAPVRSGFIYNSQNNHGGCWMNLQNPIKGDSFPQFSWHPEILWGAATLQHKGDPEYYGIWKPKDTTNFFQHAADNRLINFGSGCRIVASDLSADEIMAIIDDLILNIDNNTAPNTGFYTMSIFFEESKLNLPPFMLRLDSISRAVSERVASGRMEWMHTVDIVEKWKNEYNAEPFYISCDMQHIYDPSSIIATDNSGFSLTRISDVEYLIKSNSKISFRLYNLIGEEILSNQSEQFEINLNIENLRNGLYFLVLSYQNHFEIIKLIK